MLHPEFLAGSAAMAFGLAAEGFSLPYHPFMVALYIFLLATYVGFYVISKVPPTLHTPLMSGSNAISGITIVGSLIQTSRGEFDTAGLLGMLAVFFAMINVVGGYAVTDRMLQMFTRK